MSLLRYFKILTGAKGSTPEGAPTSTSIDSNTQALDVAVKDMPSVFVDFNGTNITINANANHSSIALKTSEVLLIASNINRRELRVSNDSNQTLLIKYGPGVTTTSYAYKLGKGDVMIENDYYGDVYGVWLNNGTGNAIISETIN